MAFFSTMNWKPRMEQLKTVVQRGGRHYVVSTADTADAGFETMVFACNAEGGSIDYTDLACERYETVKEAEKGHVAMCSEFQPCR